MLATSDSQADLILQPKKKGSGNSDSLFFNLNDYAKCRILQDMLENKVIPNCRESKNYVILVLDDPSAKMISNFCTMFDLMESGNIYQIEKLMLKRKRYPMSDVVYMCQPTTSTIQQIIEDFPEQDEFSYDHYGSVHLCFLTQVSDSLFQQMARCHKLVNKTRTLVEVNLDFKVWQDNIFKVPTKLKQMTQLLNPDKTSQQLVEQLSQKLYTICSVMGEKPYIQYQADSILCEEIAMNICKKLEYLYNYSQTGEQKKQSKKKKLIRPPTQDDQAQVSLPFREPRGTLVIMDRTFDLVTPLMHDYQYESTVFDYLPVPEDGCLDDIIKPQKSKQQRQAASENSHVLNEKDAVWEKYKSMHIAEVLGSLNDEVRELREDQAQLKKLSDKAELHHDDIQNILKTIPEFERRKAEVLIHLDLAQKVTDSMQNPRYNVMKLVEFEQTVVSGVNDQGQAVSDTTVSKELLKVIKTLERPGDKLRLLSIYLMCYGLPDADFKTLTKLVDTKEERDVLKLIRIYATSKYPDSDNLARMKRLQQQISQEDFRLYQQRYKDIGEAYDILRYRPATEKVAVDALNGQLSKELFPFLGDELEKDEGGAAAKWHKDRNQDEGRLILGIIGGISHYEICCLQNIERASGTQRMVIGSTQIITAMDFIENLVPQREKTKPVKRKQKNIMDDESEEGAAAAEENEKEEGEENLGKSGKSTASKKGKQPKGKRADDSEAQDAIELEDIEVGRKQIKQQKSKKIEDVDDEESNTSKRKQPPSKQSSKLDSKKQIIIEEDDDEEQVRHVAKKKKKVKKRIVANDDDEDS